jgi:hypothetical protein
MIEPAFQSAALDSVLQQAEKAFTTPRGSINGFE